MGSRPHSLRVAERPRPSRTVTFGIFASQKNGKIVDERRLMLQAEDHTLEWAFTLSGAEVQGHKFIQNIDLAVSALAPKSDEEPTATESGLVSPALSSWRKYGMLWHGTNWTSQAGVGVE